MSGLHVEAAGLNEGSHDVLVGQVKECKRQSSHARQAWNGHCDSCAGGVRDPREHSCTFLQSFLSAYSQGLIVVDSAEQTSELVEVKSREAALGSNQLTLRMPASEEGIMKEVVSTNVYGFLPGRTCILHEGDVILDVGAHVGIAATLALRTKNVRVVCVEPHPATFDILQQNMMKHGDSVVLLNKAVAETTGTRPLYVHSGTNAPSRLYFSSLFDTRNHNDETIPIDCVPIQNLIDCHNPTVIKIDAEGAERYLCTICNFRNVRIIKAEWDWTHNRHQGAWERVQMHLRDHGFAIDVKGRMPTFDDAGKAILCTANGKKRGNTGMIFAASRKCGIRLEETPSPCRRRAPMLEVAGANGCPVGALVCNVRSIGRVFDACRVSALAQQKGAVPYDNGRMALHLNLNGAALLCAGHAPAEVQELLDDGTVEFIPGLRRGIRSQAYCGTPSCRAPRPLVPHCFTFIDLFAGVGGARRGLEAVGGQCVFTSEIDKDCQETYALNFGDDHIFGDITAIDTQDFPKHDILAAGFPCQPFSRRGERLGFSDGRGGLFLEIPRLLHSRQPSGFLLENVWNLQFIEGGQWHKDDTECVYGEVWNYIIDRLECAGYVVIAKVINASGWVPQDRKRVYIVGFRKDLATLAMQKFKWPEPPGGGVIRSVLEPPGSPEAKSCELTDSQWAAVQRSSTWESGGSRLRFADLNGVAATLTSSYKASYATTAQLINPSDAFLERPRFFTRRECARLMGFSEDHVVGNPKCPNRAYHQLGNAMCPPLIQAIARNLISSLGLLSEVAAGEALTQSESGDADHIEESDAQDENLLEEKKQKEENEEEKEEATEELKDEKKDAEKDEEDDEKEQDEKDGEEDEEARQEGANAYLTVSGAQPELREQLAALTIEQMTSRLTAFGVPVRQPQAEEFVQGFKQVRKEELLDALCEEYGKRAETQPRQVVRGIGTPLPALAVQQLLEALSMMDWKENVRPGVHASGYVVLKPPKTLSVQPRWRAEDPRSVRRRVWELGEALLRAASPKAANFQFSAIAVSRNFRGSPHVDKNDRSVQYALSLGNFAAGGGELCVEESAFVVRAFETRGRLVCIDGRFPHWVSGYVGERYSIIFYRSIGNDDPPVQAVHEV